MTFYTQSATFNIDAKKAQVKTNGRTMTGYKLSPRSSFFFVFLLALYVEMIFPSGTAIAVNGWLKRDSEHFSILYRQPQTYLAPRILEAAENSFAKLTGIFNYTPSQKITIATFDFADIGTAGATTVPGNFIRLEIEPFELGYEHIPHHDRIAWLMDHELVHIFVNEQASKAERTARSMFSRVMPVQEQPLSIGFSLMTNHARYTPRWHQEGIASFLETWLTGGYGRALGNFDEMFFRTLVFENKKLSSPAKLETEVKDSFLLGTIYYLYGARFTDWLATEFGVEKTLDWYRVRSGEVYKNFEKKFEDVFEIQLAAAWERFAANEQKFQQENLVRLIAAPLTAIRPLTENDLGWVTQPCVDASGRRVFFGKHTPHKLTAIQSLDLETGETKTYGSLPAPSMIQIASTAFDAEHELFFYTSNNNQLYRDLHVLDIASGESKLLFEDVRVGQLTVSPQTRELWGVRHNNGKAMLVWSAFPYKRLTPVIEFDFGDVLQHLAVAPSGKSLAATLHQPDGSQSIIVADLELLKKEGRFLYKTISADGSPEFPSWSPDEEFLYWNAYTNGVSNIYRARIEGSIPKFEAVSHTQRGLFRPIHLSADSLFAFEFTSEGFRPVILPNRPALQLPAIAYYGQKVIDRNPEVVDWSEPNKKTAISEISDDSQKSYDGFSEMKMRTFAPTITGFQGKKVIGAFTHFADPMSEHNFTAEFGVAPSRQAIQKSSLHLNLNYEFKRRWRFGLRRNPADFYDLFNEVKASMSGTQLSLSHTRFLKYDNPHKITQTTDLTFYTGIKAFNDNQIAVAVPEFVVFESKISSKNTRRAIGSVDRESGQEWEIAFTGFGYHTNLPRIDGGVNASWGAFKTFGEAHNVLHLKADAGFRLTNDEFGLSRFFFGGFGNRKLENRSVKQYRETSRFPGAPSYSLSSNRFLKLTLENNLPPLRFNKIRFGQHALSHIDASWFSQGLVFGKGSENVWLNLGAQINLRFQHWFNLESTLSAGAAQVWNNGQASREWFLSLKLLRN